MGSNEDKRTPAPAPGKTGDRDLDVLIAKMHSEWETCRERDEATSRAVGDRVVAHVKAEQAARTLDANREPRRQLRGRWKTEEELAARRTALVAAAEAARKKHARRRYRTPETLSAAVREQCAAEYGSIMGFPFNEKDVAVLRPLVDFAAPTEKEARDVYRKLRKAITVARALAYALPNGTGGAAGRALFFMRGILPLLPPLSEPPFDRPARPGRAAFVAHEEDLVRRTLGKEISSRELAICSLLWGYCPSDGYRALLGRKTKGLTVAEVIERETDLVERVRK